MVVPRWLAAVLACAALAACAGSGLSDGTPDPDSAWEQVPGQSIALERGGQVLWRFHFDPALPHALFHPLALPGTPALTRDRPADHVWHHGLWLSWKYINTVNYWENARGSDRPAGRTRWKVRDIEMHGDHSARIRLSLEYAPSDGPPVLTEQRVMEISAPEVDGSYHIDWTSRFTAVARIVVLDRTPLPHEPGGRVYGGYAGLSLRLANFEERAAATVEGPVKWNPQNRFRAESAGFDYSGSLGGKTVGIAILDHPKNLNAPSSWYAIRSGSMSFFTPAVICRAPQELLEGEEFSLRYRVIVHPGRWDGERLRRESRRFFRESRTDPESGRK